MATPSNLDESVIDQTTLAARDEENNVDKSLDDTADELKTEVITTIAETSNSTADNTRPTNLDSFTSFPTLPAELRLRIWVHALPEGRVVEIAYFHISAGHPDKQWSAPNESTHPTDSLLLACRESHDEYLRHYQFIGYIHPINEYWKLSDGNWNFVPPFPAGLDRTKFPKRYVDPQVDAVYVNSQGFDEYIDENKGTVEDLLIAESLEILSRIPVMAELRFLGFEEWNMPLYMTVASDQPTFWRDHNTEVHQDKLGELKASFPKLDELWIGVDDYINSNYDTWDDKSNPAPKSGEEVDLRDVSCWKEYEVAIAANKRPILEWPGHLTEHHGIRVWATAVYRGDKSQEEAHSGERVDVIWHRVWLDVLLEDDEGDEDLAVE